MSVTNLSLNCWQVNMDKCKELLCLPIHDTSSSPKGMVEFLDWRSASIPDIWPNMNPSDILQNSTPLSVNAWNNVLCLKHKPMSMTSTLRHLAWFSPAIISLLLAYQVPTQNFLLVLWIEHEKFLFIRSSIILISSFWEFLKNILIIWSGMNSYLLGLLFVDLPWCIGTS